MTGAKLEDVRTALAAVTGETESFGIYGGDAKGDGLPTTGQRRRATRRGSADPVHRAALVLNPKGVLEWQVDTAGAPSGRRGRRAAGLPDDGQPDGDLVDVFEFETLEANAVGAFLRKVDQKFNPRLAQEPRLWTLSENPAGDRPTATVLARPPRGNRKRLLIVHGTFSKSDAILDGITASGQDAAFYKSAFKTYDEVLAFEHPTLGVSPILNALDLHRELSAIDGPLDVIAHSRGGLVARWTLEAFGVPATRVRAILVGSPLGGTSLASPPRLRSVLGLLSNMGVALKTAGGIASAYAPLLAAPLALLKVATSIIGVAARTPAIDATIQMIPGLAGQSRVSNNPELARLRLASLRPRVDYYIVSSDFQPTDPGWKFWEWFRGRRIANGAADKIFPGRNDLIVDTESMSDLPGGPAGKRDFGTNADVHHTNYFEQTKTLDYIADTFKMK